MSRNLHQIVERSEIDATLFEPDGLLRRIELLDALDSLCGDPDAGAHDAATESAHFLGRAEAFRARLEDANAGVYESIRNQILRGAGRDALLPWLERATRRSEDAAPFPSLAFDASDEIVSGVLQLRGPKTRMPLPSPEMVFYQPTPVRHIVRFVELTRMTEADVLFDLGSGLGHVPLLASILCGARCMGVELDGGAVECARECAASLRLSRVSFTVCDVRDADLSAGTVFYVYTPFSGTILESVLTKLRRECETRTIRIGTLGPCTATVARQLWLLATTDPDPEQITIFQSRA